MTEKDWITDAANDITRGISLGVILTDQQRQDVADYIKAIILTRCPFKPNVTYMEAREPPLLQCVDCKNTESCAGAMARQWNHGRCMHCGGYFRVVRA